MTPVQQGQRAAWRLFYWIAGLNLAGMVYVGLFSPVDYGGLWFLGYWLTSVLLSGGALLVGGIIVHFRLPGEARKPFWIQLIIVALATIGVLGLTCGLGSIIV